jgi:hypothetical protein
MKKEPEILWIQEEDNLPYCVFRYDKKLYADMCMLYTRQGGREEKVLRHVSGLLRNTEYYLQNHALTSEKYAILRSLPIPPELLQQMEHYLSLESL